jgi:ketosteroid isomerase-like protein
MAAATPTEVARRLLDGISARRWDRLASLYAEDAVVEIPFAAPGGISVTGRADVHAHFLAAARGPLAFTADHIVIHETADPEVVISEFDYAGPSYRFRNIQVLRVRDGKIVESRDYHDHRAIERALDLNRA